MTTKDQENIKINSLIEWNDKVISLLSREKDLLTKHIKEIEGDENSYLDTETKLKINRMAQRIMSIEAEILSKHNYNAKFIEHMKNKL